MKNSEIRELATNEIVEHIDEEKARLQTLKLNHSVSPLENHLQLKNSKRHIARLKTELRRREIEADKK